MTHKALFISAILGAMALTGCNLYFGPQTDSNCSSWNCEQEEPPRWDGPVEPGGACNSSDECEPGCYCENGVCEESGFCEIDWDCALGFECQESRATCVPEGSEQWCNNDSECPIGNFCDVATGTCIQSWGCITNEECGPGWECSPERMCVPVKCEEDSDCFEGCACQPDKGECSETGICQDDSQCEPWCDEDGTCTPMECDEERQTCTWPQSDPASCGGVLTCPVAAPLCSEDETPTILDGCYTGACLPVDQCDVEPLPLCDNIESPTQCFDRPDCVPNWTGINCTCDGEPCDCNDNPSACTCESYEYSSCSSI